MPYNESVVTYRTPEFGIVTLCDDRAFSRRPQYSSDLVEYANEFLRVLAVESVLRCFAHRDNKDVAIVAIKSHRWLVDDRLRHL